MLTSGFFNSLNSDRRYDAEQMSSIFDGIIRDGVYETVGDRFRVTPGDGMEVYVGAGRAWFDHTWTYNDGRIPLSLDAAETGLNRIDLIVLEVNRNEDTRANSVKVLTGTPATNPVEPEIVETANVKQYPLASVYVAAEVVGVAPSAITNYVGTSRCPFVIGVLEIMTIDQIVSQWEAEWDDTTDEQKAEFRAWMAGNGEEFDTWFQHLHNELDANQAANLQRQIDAIRPMTDSEIDTIWDSVFNPVEGGE